MEDVLDLYAEPPDAARPLVCFDEKPVRLLSDVRPPEPCAPGRAAREDYEYRREGTCNVFLRFAPHVGWRHVAVTERRTALDVAHQLRRLVDVDFPDATVIRLVWDNLNVHRLSVLYDAFAPAQAVAPWQAKRNAAQVKVAWRFTTDAARTKLARLYPALPS